METFFERKTGFELALISLPLGSKSARVGPAPFYTLPGPPQEGGEGLGANPVSRSGAWCSMKKDRGGGAAVGGSLETFFERKTGFELALISLPLGSKSARVFRALSYPPRPSTGGRRRSWGEPRFPLGCWWQNKKRPRRGAAVGGSVGTLLSGKRGSNPRPSAWEADALPAELFPRKIFTFAGFGTAKI